MPQDDRNNAKLKRPQHITPNNCSKQIFSEEKPSTALLKHKPSQEEDIL